MGSHRLGDLTRRSGQARGARASSLRFGTASHPYERRQPSSSSTRLASGGGGCGVEFPTKKPSLPSRSGCPLEADVPGAVSALISACSELETPLPGGTTWLPVPRRQRAASRPAMLAAVREQVMRMIAKHRWECAIPTELAKVIAA